MLSTVLNSERAIHVNIAIMRAFVRLRELLASNRRLAQKLEAMEQKYDTRLRAVFEMIRKLMAPPESTKKPIGFGVTSVSVDVKVAKRERASPLARPRPSRSL